MDIQKFQKEQKEFAESNQRHNQAQSMMMIAQVMQLRNVSKGIENLTEKVDLGNQLIQQTNGILKKIEATQDEMKDISKQNLNEAKIQNQLSVIQMTLEQERDNRNQLEKQRDENYKNYLKAQKNLAFELSESIDDIQNSKATNLEKYYFFKASEEMLDNVDIDDFEIEDKSFVRDAYKKAKNAEENYKSDFSSQDKKDWQKIKDVEKKDEDKKLAQIKNKLVKLMSVKEKIDSLHSKAQSISPKNLSKIQKEIEQLKKNIKIS
tara:strand:- start:866 stop:1657 length:792 start_codon:yes stop_codon:yes gene_type:complete